MRLFFSTSQSRGMWSMTIWAKSGWPVIGQSKMNAGALKRTTYRVPAWPAGTFSSNAVSGEAGSAGAAPIRVSPETSVLAMTFRRERDASPRQGRAPGSRPLPPATPARRYRPLACDRRESRRRSARPPAASSLPKYSAGVRGCKTPGSGRRVRAPAAEVSPDSCRAAVRSVGAAVPPPSAGRSRYRPGSSPPQEWSG